MESELNEIRLHWCDGGIGKSDTDNLLQDFGYDFVKLSVEHPV